MFKNNDKRRLYWLMEMYLTNKINASTFCDEYYYCYDLELYRATLTENEELLFLNLNKIVKRFSPFVEDIKNYPGTYYTETELKQKIIETHNI